MEDFEELKKLISSILISCPTQMTVQRLNRDFAEQVGFHIPFSKFGFSSLERCLHAMRDILELRGTGMNAEIIVHVSNKSAHIDKLIANQKTKPSRKQPFGHRPKIHSKRSRAIAILSNHHLQNGPPQLQQCHTVRSSEQTNYQVYIPPSINRQHSVSRQSIPAGAFTPSNHQFENAPPQLHHRRLVPPPEQIHYQVHTPPPINHQHSLRAAPAGACAPTHVSHVTPLMLKTVLPPKDFIASGTYTANSQRLKDEIVKHLNSQLPSQPKKGQGYVLSNKKVKVDHEPEYHESSPKRNNLDTTLPDIDVTNDTQHQGAIPKNSASISNSAPDDTEIYSSDEEEPINYRVPLKVQQNLQVLIDQHQDGIWCSKIPQTYQTLFKKELDYEDYGYKSLIQMCMDLKSIFFWYRPDKGDFKLYDRSKPPPNDLDKHFKQSDYIKTWSYLNSQPSSEPPVADVEDLVNTEPEECYPPDVAHLMDEIPRQFIPGNQEDEYIDVCVGEVYDPSKFWLMLSEYTPLLDQLMDEMQEFYMNCPELKLPPHMVKVGLYCTAVYNREYHRAIIVNLIPRLKDRVKVFFVDYGTVSSTLITNLHYLHKRFFELPQQAIRARLARIYPVNANTMWPYEVSSRFLDMVRMKRLVAHLYQIDHVQQILEVFLVDTAGDVDVYMNDALVSEGHAIFTHENQNQILLDPRFIPKVKYLHMVPTFDEMEQGVVPSATEFIRLVKAGVTIEQIYPQYFADLNMIETLNSDTDYQQSEKKSSVALRRSQLNLLPDNKSSGSDSVVDEKLLVPSRSTNSPEVLSERNSPSPEVIVAKPSIRPPPGFESIQEQKIKITTQKVNGDQLVNTVVTQTTNIESSNSQNILNYLFQNGVHPAQQQSAPTTISSYDTQNILNQLMLLRNHIAINNAQQQQPILGNHNVFPQQQMVTPTYMQQNLFNAAINQLPYPNMQGAYYNHAVNPLRLHMQDSIKNSLLEDNKALLHRFLLIIKKRALTPGPHNGLFNVIPGIINAPVTYPRAMLDDMFKEALNLLNDEDIVDLSNEEKSYSLIQSNSAATQTAIATDVNNIAHQVEQLNLHDPKLKSDTNRTEFNNNRSDSGMQTIADDHTNEQDKQLVLKIEFQNNRLHIINLYNELYAIITEILPIVNAKMPIEFVRKLIVMKDPSISVLDIRLQDHKNLLEELSRYPYVVSSDILHVVPIKLVSKLISIISNRNDLASNFDDFLTNINFTTNMRLVC